MGWLWLVDVQLLLNLNHFCWLILLLNYGLVEPLKHQLAIPLNQDFPLNQPMDFRANPRFESDASHDRREINSLARDSHNFLEIQGSTGASAAISPDSSVVLVGLIIFYKGI